MPVSDPLGRPSRVDNAFATPPPEARGGSHAEDPRLARTDHLLASFAAPPALPDVPGYRLLEVIGRGGMGTVYRAVHLATEREVALKLILAAGHTEGAARRRFEREVRALAHLDHPNVVPIYDVGVWQGFPYYTMKYLPRGTLDRHLGRLRRDLTAACRLLAKAARAVHRVHAAGVVHRDLKPENILLDDGDEPRVADFGLALGAGDGADLTASGLPVGTRLFMAPEQTDGRKGEYGPGTDVWALGVVLYEVLTGRHPFEEGDGPELYRRIREDAAPAATALNPDCPPGLGAVARRCLAKRPCDRYPSAAALADDLDRWAAGRPVAAGPSAARRPFGSAVLAAGFLAAVAGAAALVAPRPLARTAAPSPTVAERLARGEPVDLIGPIGAPLVAPAPVPGAAGLLTTDRDGLCTFAGLRFAAADLVREDVPLPVRFEAEVALSRGDGAQSWAAVYAGRKEHPGRVVAHSQAQVALARSVAPVPAGGTEVLESVTAEAFWWGPAGGVRTEVGRVQAARREPAAFPGPLVWHRVAVRLAPGRASAEASGRELGAVGADELMRLGDGFGRRGWLPNRPAGADPAFGPGVGLAVNNAEAVYRNARLVPDVTNHP